MAEKALEKIGILLNDLECNSSSSNEEKQNEDVESVMAGLYPSGRGQGGERKRLKIVRAHAAADTIFFYQNIALINRPRGPYEEIFVLTNISSLSGRGSIK